MDKYKIDHNKIDDLSENMSQVFEATSQAYNLQKNVALSKGSAANDFDTWKQQMKGEKANLLNSMNKSSKQVANIVKSATTETIKEAKKNDLEIKNDLKKPSVKLIKEEGEAIKLYEKAIEKDFDNKVKKIYQLKNQVPLFDAILKYTNEGGIQNAPKINYRDGKTFSFKAYMEMNVRTTIRQEVNEVLFEASKNNGVVFYLANSFSDCAKDHQDYDGKMFYDKDWVSFGYDEEISAKIEAYIQENDLMSYQFAIEQGFTTRPNCRHSLTPMTIDEVLENSVSKLLKDNNLNAKSPRNDENYLITQQQRYFERQVRAAKMALENHSAMLNNMPSEKLQEMIQADKEKIANYQKELQTLMKKHGVENGGFLKRDYRRENPAVVVQDAGVRYTMGIRGASASQVSNLIEEKKVMEIKQEPVKEIRETISIDDMPDILKSKKLLAHSEKLVEALNNKDINADVVKLYKGLKKLINNSSLETNAKVGVGKVIMSYTESTIFLDRTNSVATDLHEVGHLIDRLLYKDHAKQNHSTYVSLDKEFSKIILNEKNHVSLGNKVMVKEGDKYVAYKIENNNIGQEAKDILIKENEKVFGITGQMNEKYRSLFDENSNKYKNNEITYKEYEKQYTKILSQKRLDTEIMENEQLNGASAFMDIYDALSGGFLRQGISYCSSHNNGINVVAGHGVSYFSNINNRKLEIWADYLTLNVKRPDLLKVLRKDKPELCDYLDSIIKKAAEEIENEY